MIRHGSFDAPARACLRYAEARASGLEPTLKVERILHRNNPIFLSTTVGKPIKHTHMLQSLNRTATLWHNLEAMKIPGFHPPHISLRTQHRVAQCEGPTPRRIRAI